MTIEGKKEMLGRNDPCHCGSGKKYKKRCLAGEEERVREGRSALVESQFEDLLDYEFGHDGDFIEKNLRSRRKCFEKVLYTPWQDQSKSSGIEGGVNSRSECNYLANRKTTKEMRKGLYLIFKPSLIRS